MARVAVIGVGAIGGALAALLETSGPHEITLCTRRPLPLLHVDTPAGAVQVKARNVTDPAKAEAVDWVFVATKAYDAAGAAAWFPALCVEGARVAIVQNGVEHRERFTPWMSAERLLPVVIECSVERRAEDRVEVRGKASLKVEESALGSDFAALFSGGAAKPELRVEVTADFVTAEWAKLCLNCVGALNGLALRPSGAFQNEVMGEMTVAMARECVAVGRAEGAKLADSLAEEVLAHYRRQPADSVHSLLADRLAGRRTEWDARNGAVVRKGEKHGIATPLNRMAAAVLEAAEQ